MLVAAPKEGQRYYYTSTRQLPVVTAFDMMFLQVTRLDRASWLYPLAVGNAERRCRLPIQV